MTNEPGGIRKNQRVCLPDGREAHVRIIHDDDSATVRLLDGTRATVPLAGVVAVRRKAAREAARRRALKADGKCVCGRKLDGQSPTYCDRCTADRAEWQRQRQGTNAWKPGGRGRPPYRAR